MSLKLLAIDTTTEACSVALLNRDLIQEQYQLAPRQHTQLILPMLELLFSAANLKSKDLHAIAFCRGPGSFTGCRIAASVVQAVAFAADIPVILISSLQCLAQGAYRELKASRVIASIDAHMDEIYWASYQLDQENIMTEFEKEQIVNPKQIQVSCPSPFIGVGSGWDKYNEVLCQQIKQDQLQQWYPQRYPRAYDVLTLAKQAYQRGELVSAQAALPLYLREKVV
jgi:tRNA threonylcarbamoyladenosine biosynthesis protein TsaB